MPASASPAWPRIAGLEPNSLLDFPGKLAAVLFLRGCNLACPWCHNRTLIAREEGEVSPCAQAGAAVSGYPLAGAAPRTPDLSESALRAFLEERRGFLDGVVVTGGEPTLSPGLPALLRRLKAWGYAVKLDTNGTRPAVLAGILDAGLADYVAMDLKAPLGRPELLAELCGLPASRGPAIAAAMRASLDLLARWKAADPARRDWELRTTCAPGLGPAELEALAAEAAAAPRWALQAWRPVENAADGPEAQALSPNAQALSPRELPRLAAGLAAGGQRPLVRA